MLQQLINLVKENAGDAILNNPVIPEDRKEEAVEEAGHSIAGGLQHVLSQGGVKDFMNLFNGSSPDLVNNPVTEQVTGSFVKDMSSKIRTLRAAGGAIASSLIPMVMSQLVKKTNDPADKSFDLQDMFNQFSGGKTSGLNISSLLSKAKAGLDRDGDGDIDFNDLKTMFSGSGNVIEKIKGILSDPDRKA